jgi:PAS domain S-box-containing protein
VIEWEKNINAEIAMPLPADRPTGATDEEKLRKEAELLSVGQRLARIGAWEFDRKNGSLVWTDEVYRIFGLDRETFTPTFDRYLALIHPDDRPRIEADFATIMERPHRFGEFIGEYRIVRPDGSVRRVAGRVEATIDADGRPGGMTGAVQDQTDQWRIDEAFRTIASGVGASSNQEFFDRLTGSMGDLLQAEITAVGRFVDDTRRLKITSLTVDGRPLPPSIIDTADTPFATVAATGTLIIPEGAAKRFARFPWLTRERVEGFIGVALRSREGRLLGVMAAMTHGPLSGDSLAERLLTVFAERASVELERILAMEALVESEGRIHSILETTLQGFWLVDRRQTTLQINSRMAQILGQSQEKILGHSIYDFVDSVNAPIFAEQARHRGDGAHGVYEIELTGFDGTKVPCLFSASPLYDTTGEVVGSFALVTDISERKRVERRLRRSEETLARAQRIAKIGSWSWDLSSDRMPLSIEGYRIMGMEKTAPPPAFSDFMQMADAAERDRLFDALQETLDTGSGFATEAPFRLNDGRVRLLAVEGEVDRGADGRPIGMVGALRDVTDQRRLEREREELERQVRQTQKLESLGVVAGGLSHDFNNILQQLLSLINVLAPDVDPSSRSAYYLDLMKKTVHRGSEMVRRIMVFSRQTIAERRRIDMDELVEDSARFVTSLLPENTTLVRRFEGGPHFVDGDASQLRQVVVNLCLNAAQAMPGGGTAVIKVASGKGDDGRPTVRLTVTDTGPGVADEIRENIYDPFFTTRHGEQGAGLGLSVAHGIVTAHEGIIGFENEPVGGATFFVALPPSRSPAPTARPVRDLAGETLHILFIDDEELIADTTVIMLRGFGHTVEGFTEPYQLLTRLDEGPVDALVTDLSMPEMTGTELARRVRERWPDVAIVLCTGYGKTDDLNRVNEGIIDTAINKPVEPEALIQAVVEAVRRRHERDDPSAS